MDLQKIVQEFDSSKADIVFWDLDGFRYVSNEEFLAYYQGNLEDLEMRYITVTFRRKKL